MEKPLDVTKIMVDEHKLILRMITLLEKKCADLEAGRKVDFQFFLDAVDFIRNYADRFHHGKEEDVLFVELIKNGMPEKNSPVAAMLVTHDEGRAFVRAMEEAAKKALAGDAVQTSKIVENGWGYAKLLRNHIEIEDGVLYPLAERVLPADRREGMAKAYEAQEAASPELTAKYMGIVAKYEKE